MLKIVCLFMLLSIFGCSARYVNGRPQTFTEYVILNKYSKFNLEEHKKLIESQDVKDTAGTIFRTQPLENYPGVRLEIWLNSETVENM